jgi:hypothetical protein
VLKVVIRVQNTHCHLSKNTGCYKDGRYDDPKRRRKENRSTNNVMRNRFPNRSVRRRKQEGVGDALVE